MKSRIVLCAILFALLNTLNVKAQQWEWAKSVKNSNSDKSECIATDVFGNSYIAGSFNDSTIIFGTYTLINNSTSVNKQYNIFIAKYDSVGNVVWAKSAGGSVSDNCLGVTTDIFGNIYITGCFNSPILIFGTDTLINNGNPDIYTAKYNSDGDAMWARSVGSDDEGVGFSVAADASGNVYVAGRYFSSSIIFGSDTLINSKSGQREIFLLKYDSAGNEIWGRTAGDTMPDGAYSTTTDKFGNVYIAGNFYSQQIIFGTDTLINTYYGRSDIFLAKYDSAGNVVWAKNAGGSSYDDGFSVAADTFGNVYVTGTFRSSYILFGTDSLVNADSKDVFLLKYDVNGNEIWGRSTGGYAGYGVSTDKSGNIYVTGASGGDIFLIKYNTAGKVVWVEIVGDTSSESAKSVATDIFGNVYITGDFYSSGISFGTTVLTNISGGGGDIFIAKLHDNNTGINERLINSSIKLYPNPNNGTFTINITDINKTTNLSITNLQGQEVYKEQLNTTHNYTKQLDMSNYPKGIYFLKLQNNNAVHVEKMVIQ